MKRPGAVLAAAAAALSCAATAWHILSDRAAPSFDEAWYLEVSFRLWHALADGRPLAFLAEYAGAFRTKAPLISVIPLPLYAFLGPSHDAAALANLPAAALLALSLYGLGRRFFSETAGGLAAALALLMPMTAHLSRLYFVEAWLTALTALFLWRWVESDCLGKEGSAVPLGALAGLGLLTKVLFPLSALPPAALALHERRPRIADLEAPFKAFLAAAAAVALSWYGPNLVYVVGYVYEATLGDIPAHYVSAPPFSPAAIGRYGMNMSRDGFSWPIIVLLISSLSLLGPRRVRGEPGLRFALAWLLPALSAAALGPSKELRFAAPALPGAALALAGALDLLTRGLRARPLVLTLALALPLDLLCRQTFGTAMLPPSRLAPAATVYGGPPRPAPAFDAELLLRLLSARISGPAVVVLGTEHAQLNANLLSAWAARAHLPLAFVHYGHMEDRVEKAVARMSEKDATHIVFLDGAPAMFPRVDAGLRALVAAGKLPFRRTAAFAVAPGLSAELWERTGPIRMVAIIAP